MMPTNARARWAEAWREAGGSFATKDILFDDLTMRFREFRRHHHAMPHIDMMLDELDLFRASAPDEAKQVHFPAVKMMTWYHDTVYNPVARDNEVQSARLFSLVAHLAYLEETFIQRVIGGILATARHEPPDDPSIRVLLDLDLVILGKPQPVFDRYEEHIRLEYDEVPIETFREERRKILRKFLARPRIFQTDFFRDRYEAQAQENLKRSIERLS